MNIISAPSDAQDLVIVYHGGGSLKFPGAVVASETRPGFKQLYDTLGGEGITPLPDAIAEVGEKIGRPGWQPDRVVLAGFSEGCQGVRAQLRAGYDASAVVAADGTHAAASPNYASQIDPWKSFANLAKAGQRTMIASHSTIPTTYKSTRETLRLITGFPLDDLGTADNPAVSQEGNLTVYSVDGTQAADHVLQGNVLMPRMIGEALTSAPSVASLVGGASGGGWFMKALGAIGCAGLGFALGRLLARELGGR
jgi:hypothetical protein